MNTSSKIIALIYGILGFIFFALGVVGFIILDLSIPTVSDAERYTDLFEQLSDSIKHLTMELSASIIALGGLLSWGAFNVSQTKKLDYLFIGYFVLFAGLHWFEFAQGNRTIASPLINSIPLVLFIIVYFLRGRK